MHGQQNIKNLKDMVLDKENICFNRNETNK